MVCLGNISFLLKFVIVTLIVVLRVPPMNHVNTFGQSTRNFFSILQMSTRSIGFFPSRKEDTPCIIEMTDEERFELAKIYGCIAALPRLWSIGSCRLICDQPDPVPAFAKVCSRHAAKACKSCQAPFEKYFRLVPSGLIKLATLLSFKDVGKPCTIMLSFNLLQTWAIVTRYK